MSLHNFQIQSNLITIKKYPVKSFQHLDTFMITTVKITLIYGYGNGKVYTCYLKLILYVKSKLIKNNNLLCNYCGEAPRLQSIINKHQSC